MISKSPFGRTGHASSRTLFGAAALGQVSQDQADAALELAIGHGVNHVDTAASYGESELRIGSWLRRNFARSNLSQNNGVERTESPFFLATKTAERKAEPARAELLRSLERLGVDRIDLWQLHNLVEPEGWQTALGPGGALEAAIAARDEGLVRFIGVTGHGLNAPTQHQLALERFDFDSVLFPFSFILSQNAEYWASVEALLGVCAQRGVAVQTIKAVVRAPWGEPRPLDAPTWYEPLTEQHEIDLAVHWVLSHPGVFLNTVGDVNLLPRVLDAAERQGGSPAPAVMRDQLERLGMRHLFTVPHL